VSGAVALVHWGGMRFAVKLEKRNYYIKIANQVLANHAFIFI
jgi:hypothetical protein